jgi:hypothetical protein
MHKQAFDWDKAISTYGPGAAAGVSIAALAGLLRHVGHLKRVARDNKPEDQIEVYLPRKKAEARQALTQSKEITGIPGQTRAIDGRFSIPTGKTRDKRADNIIDKGLKAWTRLMTPDPEPNNALAYTSKALGIGGSALLAYLAASQAEKAYRRHQLKKELEAAKKHYVKTVHKTAQDAGEVQVLPAGLAAMLLIGLGLTGSSAYFTKTYLDQKEKEDEDEGFDYKRSPKVVFRSYDPSKGLKSASSSDLEAQKFALGVYMDMLGENQIVGSPEFRTKLAEAQVDYQDFEKAAQGISDINLPGIYASLRDKHPEAANALMQLVLKDDAVKAVHPVKARLGSFIRRIPGFRGLVDNAVLGNAVSKLQSGPEIRYAGPQAVSVTPQDYQALQRRARYEYSQEQKAKQPVAPQPPVQPKPIEPQQQGS